MLVGKLMFLAIAIIVSHSLRFELSLTGIVLSQFI